MHSQIDLIRKLHHLFCPRSFQFEVHALENIWLLGKKCSIRSKQLTVNNKPSDSLKSFHKLLCTHDLTDSGYCHFNEGNHNGTFTIELFGNLLRLNQNPSAHNLGHGTVVWDASVVFAKYMENNAKEFDPSKLTGKTLLELGSGCGLAGISFMLRGAAVTCTDMEKVTSSLTAQHLYSSKARTRKQWGSHTTCSFDKTSGS